MICCDFLQFSYESRVVHIDTSETSQGLGSALLLPFPDAVAWCFRKDSHSGEKDDGPGELNCDWDSVGPTVVAIFRAVVDDGGDKEANCDGELVGANDGATNPFRCGFGLIHGDYR